jgi:aminopeptidase-like protein
MKNKIPYGHQMYDLMKKLLPINRSISGDGVRKTLYLIKEIIKEFNIHEAPSGKRCFDWELPYEWNVSDAYISDEHGNKVIDIKDNYLHLMGYSIPIKKKLSLSELELHLHSLPDQPDAIPYLTSYYKDNWGFCITHNQRKKLKNQLYSVVIESEKKIGSISYADFIIPGKSKKEVFITTYSCHPMMANNETSGLVLITFLAQWLLKRNNFYTYRFMLGPETIGAIIYLDKHLEHLKRNTVAAFNLTCVGDDRAVSLMPSRSGQTMTDRLVRHYLKYFEEKYIEYDFLKHRGSNERQYCSPGVDLPMVSIMRSKYLTYPEYHTSLDNISLVSPQSLQKSFDIHVECIEILEANRIYNRQIICEPHLARRKIFERLGGGTHVPDQMILMMNFLTCCDGKADLLSISEKLGVYIGDLNDSISILEKNNIIIDQT